MSTTVLTDEQVGDLYQDWHFFFKNHPGGAANCIRAIEQAVLQSPEVQALRKDAELWRAMQEHSVVTFMNDYGRKLAIATVEIGRFPEKLALEQFVRAAMEEQ